MPELNELEFLINGYLAIVDVVKNDRQLWKLTDIDDVPDELAQILYDKLAMLNNESIRWSDIHIAQKMVIKMNIAKNPLWLSQQRNL